MVVLKLKKGLIQLGYWDIGLRFRAQLGCSAQEEDIHSENGRFDNVDTEYHVTQMSD